MRLAVADTGPLHYLVLIGEIGFVAALVGEVVIPLEVRDELQHARTPVAVRDWIAAPPPWLRIAALGLDTTDQGPARLGPGERAAIMIALRRGADVVLMDDRAGVVAARARGLQVIGTLGLLQRAGRRGLVDLSSALGRLAGTNFHVRQDLFDALLAEAEGYRRKGPG